MTGFTIQRTTLMTLLILVLGAPAWGQSTDTPSNDDTLVRTVKEYNLPKKDTLAIKGYDPVAYFPEGGGKATKGKKNLAYTFKGVTYRFASDSNRNTFRDNPTRYEPAHGGWCSWAMISGEKTGPNPKSFIVKDNRLFLFYDGLLGNTRKQWLQTKHDDSAAAADKSWKRISREAKRQVSKKDKSKPSDG